MRNIKVEFVKEMRYATAGDYFIKDGETVIQVYDQGDDEHNFLIFIHEAIEQFLTERAGIKEEDILKYDEQSKDEEPGDNPEAPYHIQHIQATIVEKLLAKYLNLAWSKYDAEIKVYEPKGKS